VNQNFASLGKEHQLFQWLFIQGEQVYWKWN